jgi:uncharacterized protein YjbI with pentapeptide repeats
MATKATGRVRPRVDEDLAPENPSLLDEARVTDVAIVGDYTGLDIERAEVVTCRLERALFIRSQWTRGRIEDCLAIGCDFSGAVWEECTFTRVEFQGCRFSGLQAQSLFKDVGFFDCKIDGANLRMSDWQSAEFQNCDLSDSDFYGAKLPGTRFDRCDLSGLQLAKADLNGARLQGSTIQGIKGGDGLRGVSIGSDQVLAVALAVFGDLGISVDDEPD